MEYLTDHDYAIALQNGITHQQAYDRFYRMGWTKQRTITEPVTKGYLWDTYGERCKENGIKKMTFYQRMRAYGMTAEEASSSPLLSRGGNFTNKRKMISDHLVKIAESNGISKSTLRYRIRVARWPTMRAATEPVRRENCRKEAKRGV